MLSVARYLERIGWDGAVRVDFETLRELHRRHLLAIPYENLDVQLGRPVGLDIAGIYRKVVDERRGGWCYEMNGLLAWALESLGFSLTRLAAGVWREQRGDAVLGNHLALWVHLDRSYLADVGFGDGMFEPIPIEDHAFLQRGFEYRLENLQEGWWRFHNHVWCAAPSFDFHLSPADPSLLEQKCQFLQTSPQSGFTQVAVVQRHLPGGIATLRGRTFKRITTRGVGERVIVNRDDYAQTLSEVFALEPPELDRLWEKVVRQHEAFLAQQQ
jgi:N-hydroxyarylamine O-acetyltransferase